MTFPDAGPRDGEYKCVSTLSRARGSLPDGGGTAPLGVSATKRAAVAVGAVGAILTIGAVAFAYVRADEAAPFHAVTLVGESATVRCQGSIVELEFDPAGNIEVRVRGKAVAVADAARRGLNADACADEPTQRGWGTAIPYRRSEERKTITCRFPGHFFVHVHPVSPSWAGGRPAGSAVYLVLGKRLQPGSGPNRTILASASVVERYEESRVVFAHERLCTAS